MNLYESMIDPARFGAVAKEANCPFSDIDYFVYVRDRSILAGLAEQLTPFTAPGRMKPENLPAVLADALKAGTVLVSSFQPLGLPDSQQFNAVDSIPRRARCDVIYMPPFYLVHAPGLFEGTLAKPKSTEKPELKEQALRQRPSKL